MMTITIQEVIDKQLAVVDLTASIMCMENHVADGSIQLE